jgi:uncharacterized lipoprotein YddW (UPF0748 family)
MKRIRFLGAGLLCVIALVVVVVALLGKDRSPPPQVRALWVTRFNYSSPEDVRRIIANLAEAGITDVFFQVRGSGTAFYDSKLEPWAHELSSGNVQDLGKDPGWDPLQLAIDEARPHGVRVHAYMNVLPGWVGLEEPPAEVGQLWTEHPDWFMIDSLGAKMLPTSGWYAFINPVLPEVRQHLRGLVNELCRYDVAGIHLDYIRYPYDYHLVARQRYPNASEDELMRHSDFSYDPLSQTRLFDLYGWEVSKEQVVRFRCDSVTRVVRDISYVMELEMPDGGVLSASVLGNPVEGRHFAYQDSARWVRQGLVDWVVQMNYGVRSFSRYLSAMKKAVGKEKFNSSVVVGINCKHDVSDILSQVETVQASGCRGYALFAYTFLFDEQHVMREKGRMLFSKLRP